MLDFSASCVTSLAGIDTHVSAHVHAIGKFPSPLRRLTALDPVPCVTACLIFLCFAPPPNTLDIILQWDEAFRAYTGNGAGAVSDLDLWLCPKVPKKAKDFDKCVVSDNDNLVSV